MTVISVGSKYEVYVRSPASSHMQPFNNPFEPCNKVRGKYIVKEVFLRFPSCFLSSCIFLCASVFTIIELL